VDVPVQDGLLQGCMKDTVEVLDRFGGMGFNLAAEEEDAAAIAELCSNELGFPTSAEQVKEKLTTLLKSGQDKILVAVADKQIVGFIHATSYETHNESQYMEGIVIRRPAG
jgi:hypothetical protein